MEPAKKQLPLDVTRTHGKITDLYNSNDTLTATGSDLQALSRAVSKMKGRFNEDNIQATVDHCF